MFVFYERCDFETLCSLSWLLLMMMIYYVDEFLIAMGDDFDGVCMYWKMLMIIVDDLLCECMHYWVICSCIYKSDIYIHIGNDANTLYSYWRWKWYIWILRWRPWWWTCWDYILLSVLSGDFIFGYVLRFIWHGYFGDVLF